MKEKKDSANSFLTGTEFCEIPGRVEDANRVKTLASQFAKMYELRVEIQEGDWYVRINLYGNDMMITPLMKQDLTELTSLCDDMTIATKGLENADFCISWAYYTHDAYINGRRCRLMQ